VTDKIFDIYQRRKARFEKELAGANRQSNLLVMLRSLIAVLITGFIGYWFYTKKLGSLFYPAVLLVVFIVLVVLHRRTNNKINYLQNLVRINETALLRLSGKWTTLPETGNRFFDPGHPYSTDLNIFGQGSLFQYINATTSYMGGQTLAQFLSRPAGHEEILPRQQAVKELAQELDWRQHFQAIGTGSVDRRLNPAGLIAWAEDQALVLDKKRTGLIRVLPVITISLLILKVLGIVPLFVPLIMLLVQLITVNFSEKAVRKTFDATGRAVAELECYSALLACIEEKGFQAPLLTDLKKRLGTNNQPSSVRIKALSKITDRINLRSAQLHFLINLLTFWDLHTLIKLEKWKVKSGMSLGAWLKVIGQFEALAGLAGLAHDHPGWAFPEVVDNPPFFEAVELGHPLVHDNVRVCNDVYLPDPGTVFIITGSNMSGKSTFLRTVGINLVLAYAGGPVCARSMSCSMMNVYTSMQVHDNLEQRTSTFYAELKRIKTIVDAVNNGEPVVFLLDEIFKGTNSRDRIFGAKTLIKKLCRMPVIGLITTHDLELGGLEKEIPRCVKNYHFTDTICDNQISFDYRLRPGISRTTNAIALMKMVGIEVGDEGRR
jgi:hypothetical protein